MASQIEDTVLAIPAFVPLTVCTGYVAAWFTNLHGFRQRSLVERLLWSIPLSISLSTISLVLIGKFVSLGAASALLPLGTVVFLIVLTWEWRQLRRSGRSLTLGLRPLGGAAIALAIIWIALVLVSLVDFQQGPNLYSSLFLWDHSARISWTESVLRTGIPPDNPLYFYQHPAPMRNYYFWYVICAVVVKISHLPPRAVLSASCVWAGFALAAIIGLYLKYFLHAGARLRKQFLLAIALLSVTGLDICINVLEFFFLHRPLPLDLEWWSHDEIYSWYGSLHWVPHHVTSLVCCMFAFLLAWRAGDEHAPSRFTTVALIGAACASAFGLSIFVPFAFLLVMIMWGIWQVAFERTPRPAFRMAAGGVFAAVLLLPYLWELTHASSRLDGGSVFTFGIREMIPAGALLTQGLFRHLVTDHPGAARTAAKLILFAPGFALELGFYFLVLLVYLVPAMRSHKRLSAEQRSLVFIAIAILPVISFIRSAVLTSNDFGVRAPLILQFALLLLASDLLMDWRLEVRTSPGSTGRGHRLLRDSATLTIMIGILSTISQAMLIRFDLPIIEAGFRAKDNPQTGIISHNAYISYLGYEKLASAIPPDSIVQFNPGHPWAVWKSIDVTNVNHQIAIASDQPWCGSELGGNPAGCPEMIATIDPLFRGATAEQARTACHQYGLQYLIAKVYDPAWADINGWVWNLKPVVADPEFRALYCR